MQTRTREADPETPQAVVRAGYDKIAGRYFAWSDANPSEARRRALELALEAIPPGSEVLELGSGAGVPMTAALAAGRRVTGIDISPAQIALATANVRTATFQQADIVTYDRPPASVDAVVAFYSLTHVPREELRAVLERIRRWLRPGGVFLASFGVEDDPGGIEEDWLGVPMYFSHFSARVNRRIVEEAGFLVERADVLVEPADRYDARFLWILARTPRDAG